MSIDFTPEPQGIDFTPEAQMQPQASKSPLSSPFSEQSQGVLGQLANGTVNFVNGVGDSVRQFGTDVLNLPLRGANMLGANAPLIPYNPSASSGSGLAYGAGNIAGNIGAFLGGGAGLDAGRAASEGMPLLGKIASALGTQSFLPSLARRAIGSGIGGAVVQPNSPGTGAAEGAGFSAGIDLASPTLGYLTNTPAAQRLSENIMNQLGGGQSIENNAQSLANTIKNAFQTRVAQGGNLYDNSLRNFYNSRIIDPLNGSLPPSAYQSLPNSVTQSYGYDLKNLHNQFIDNPTVTNAHNLQSQLGTEIRGISKNPNLSAADRDTLQKYQAAQDGVNTDLNNFLNVQSPINPQTGLSAEAEQYQNANEFWKNNVVPYKENPAIAKIATEKVVNPRNIANVFKNPEPGVQQVSQDLGPKAQNQILYSQLGKLSNNLTPEGLTNAFNKLDSQGLSSYVSPQLETQFNRLNTLTKGQPWKQHLQQAAGLGAGIGLGSLLGLPHAVGETLGGIVGGIGGPLAAHMIQKGAQFLSPAVPYFRPASRAILGASLPQGQGG